MSRKSSGQQNPYFRQTPDLSQRHPAPFLNVFEMFSPILRHSTPPDFPKKCGSMPQVA
jgi:hypothetical protein